MATRRRVSSAWGGRRYHGHPATQEHTTRQHSQLVGHLGKRRRRAKRRSCGRARGCCSRRGLQRNVNNSGKRPKKNGTKLKLGRLKGWHRQRKKIHSNLHNRKIPFLRPTQKPIFLNLPRAALVWLLHLVWLLLLIVLWIKQSPSAMAWADNIFRLVRVIQMMRKKIAPLRELVTAPSCRQGKEK